MDCLHIRGIRIYNKLNNTLKNIIDIIIYNNNKKFFKKNILNLCINTCKIKRIYNIVNKLKYKYIFILLDADILFDNNEELYREAFEWCINDLNQWLNNNYRFEDYITEKYKKFYENTTKLPFESVIVNDREFNKICNNFEKYKKYLNYLSINEIDDYIIFLINVAEIL